MKYLPKVKQHVLGSCGWRELDLRTERRQLEPGCQGGGLPLVTNEGDSGRVSHLKDLSPL